MAQKTMIQAITDALASELAADENVLVFGEDVGNNGGVSVLLKASKKNLVKNVYLIHR